MRFKTLRILPVLLGTILLFNSCKKFPENNLWFSNPEKVFKGGKITSYTFNTSFDQMPYWKAKYSEFPYNYFGAPINNVFDEEFSFNKSTNEIKSVIGEGTFKFNTKKKWVEIYFHPVNEAFGAENIFLAHINWKIVYLDKKGKMIIETEYNLKTYRIQFN